MAWWPRKSVSPPPAPAPAAPPTREQRIAAGFTRTGRAAGCFLLIVAAAWVLGQVAASLWVVLFPIILGLLLASLLAPVANRLRRWLPATAAAGLTLVGAVAIVGGLIASLVPQVRRQAPELADAVTAGLERLRDTAARPPFNLDDARLDTLIIQAGGRLEENAQQIADGVLSGAATAGSLLLNALLAAILTFFFLKDGPKFLPWLADLTGPAAGPHVIALGTRTWAAMAGFMWSQTLVGLIDAVAIGIGLAVLGVPLAVPLAVLVFFGAFIPVVGGLLTGVVAALVTLVALGPTHALIVVVLVVVVQQVEGNVIQPLLVGKTLNLHAAVVMLAVTAGAALFGIAGAFLAVPAVAAVATALRYANEHLGKPAAAS